MDDEKDYGGDLKIRRVLADVDRNLDLVEKLQDLPNGPSVELSRLELEAASFLYGTDVLRH